MNDYPYSLSSYPVGMFRDQSVTQDQRYFPVLPFLAGLAVSPFLFGDGGFGGYGPYQNPYQTPYHVPYQGPYPSQGFPPYYGGPQGPYGSPHKPPYQGGYHW